MTAELPFEPEKSFLAADDPDIQVMGAAYIFLLAPDRKLAEQPELIRCVLDRFEDARRHLKRIDSMLDASEARLRAIMGRPLQ